MPVHIPQRVTVDHHVMLFSSSRALPDARCPNRHRSCRPTPLLPPFSHRSGGIRQPQEGETRALPRLDQPVSKTQSKTAEQHHMAPTGSSGLHAVRSLPAASTVPTRATGTNSQSTKG